MCKQQPSIDRINYLKAMKEFESLQRNRKQTLCALDTIDEQLGT